MKKYLLIAILLVLAFSFIAANIHTQDKQPNKTEVEKPAQPSMEDYQKLSAEVKERITDIKDIYRKAKLNAQTQLTITIHISENGEVEEVLITPVGRVKKEFLNDVIEICKGWKFNVKQQMAYQFKVRLQP